MEPYVIIVLVIAIIAVIVSLGTAMFFHSKKEKHARDKLQRKHSALANRDQLESDLTIKFEDLPALTEIEDASLVEVKDKQLLARIDNVIPGTLQAIANAGAVNNYQQAAKNAGQLYQAIVPKGAHLLNSRAMDGAVRGAFQGPNGLGQANFIPVDGSMGNGLAAMNVTSGVMAVASMVVGQYYMTQINDQLGDINKELDKLSSFQDKEFLAKIYAIIAEVQTCSQFKLEIVDNEEQRKRELDHLKSLEHECAELLGQANLTLKDFEKKTDLDYSEYEKYVFEAEKWYQYQQILLKILLKIEELTYSLYLGEVSREYCYSKFIPYAKQADDALISVETWHKKNSEALEIDLEASRRRRQGIGGLLMSIPAMFNDDLHYKDVSQSTVSMISNQSSGKRVLASEDGTDLFREDVRLIAKDGKLYYLPQSNPDNTSNGDEK
jgi:hypothetical protein